MTLEREILKEIIPTNTKGKIIDIVGDFLVDYERYYNRRQTRYEYREQARDDALKLFVLVKKKSCFSIYL